MKIFENTSPSYKDVQILGMYFSLPTSPLTPPLVMSNASNSCLEFATLKRELWRTPSKLTKFTFSFLKYKYTLRTQIEV